MSKTFSRVRVVTIKLVHPNFMESVKGMANRRKVHSDPLCFFAGYVNTCRISRRLGKETNPSRPKKELLVLTGENLG